MGLKTASDSQEVAFKTTMTEALTSASREALTSASREAYPHLTPSQPQKKPATTWSKSFSQTVLKMAADEAAHIAATEQAEKTRRYEADLRNYIRSTIPSRTEFIEPLDDYSSGYSDSDSDDYIPPAEEDDEKPVDYLHYGSRRNFADA